MTEVLLAFGQELMERVGETGWRKHRVMAARPRLWLTDRGYKIPMTAGNINGRNGYVTTKGIRLFTQEQYHDISRVISLRCSIRFQVLKVEDYDVLARIAEILGVKC